MKKPGLVLCGSLDGWLRERMKSIGSSESPAILGVSGFKGATPLAVYLSKTSPTASEESEPQRWGHRLESAVADEFGERSGLPVVAPLPWSLYRTEEAGFMHATPDRFVGEEARPGAILEVKTTRYGGMKRADGSFSDEWEHRPPLRVQVQVQHQLLVLGLEVAYVAVLIGGQEYRSFEVRADAAFQGALQEKLAAFWDRVARHDPPPQQGASDFENVRRMFSRSSGKVIALPMDVALVRGRWLQAKRVRIEAEQKERAAATELMAILGSAEIGVLPDGTGVKWSNETRKEQDREARTTTVRVLRALKDAKGLLDGSGVDGTEAKPAGDDVGEVRTGPGEVPAGGQVDDLRQPGD